MSDPLLSIKNMHVHYGAIHAIHGINLDVYEGEIVTLLGSNGAGKTTTLHSISGLIPLSSGEILYDGKIINGTPAHKIVGMGIAQSPEGRLVFPDLTVKENLEMGSFLRKDDRIGADLQEMIQLFPKLKERSKQLAGTLSGGEQQMLAIARAYMAKPKVLLLDEPSLGIAPILVQAIFEAIVQLNKKGMTILLVEQNAYAALKIAHRGYVLTTGEIAMQGPASELLSNPEIQKAYLGH
ncbi:MAG: ABC transporter ATP-binding protein [Bdellovibrio sp. CG12_big_fil_rev_8_21_14_0_65_39_13]|nr:MAG: ABC transporter ATP-binding protein [Bdellovibrio sp. CG22_combo_CG10-13_8_21_14_all_39_27]PIQ57795.1 MAG: ABC transporter ATP-binding protein [Bdellovibrio sp. CG12_big_fil_rev_8_21_14_0_65_39_13]PIR34669.1 MAG: ABC transporter ATP-binding protein [Bdellovibrio sp. CG11_big_fil_rev_8_21_14_0_20_39_38]PJB54106.1 MAG: ABC transporter ATP-binding protein [Bdellovibrio sp. CG_4_9_14_3_um_filter_39_7]